MSTPTPSIPGVDRDALVTEILRDAVRNGWSGSRLADVVIAHIAAHHECACDREHADEWVEVDMDTWLAPPRRARRRMEWAVGVLDGGRPFVHRDDLPDDPDREILLALGDVLDEMGMPPADAGYLTRLIRAAGFDVVPRKADR